MTLLQYIHFCTNTREDINSFSKRFIAVKSNCAPRDTTVNFPTLSPVYTQHTYIRCWHVHNQDFSSPSALRSSLITTLHPSTELCWVPTGFLHLLFVYACGGTHGVTVIPKCHIFVCHLLDFLEQNEDDTGRFTNNPDGLPSHPD